MRWERSLWSNVQSFLLYVFFHTFGNKSLDGTFGANCTADFRSRNLLIYVVEQVQGDSGEHEIAGCRLLREGFRDLRPWPEFFGQGAGDISQRESRAACDDEFAFGKQRLGLSPLGNVFESVNSDQKKQPVNFLERLLQLSDCVDTVIRRRCHASLRTFLVVKNEFAWRFQQRRDKRLLSLGRKRRHGITMDVRGHRLRRLVRRHIGGNEIHAAQLATFLRGSGEREMSFMDGIKGAAK